MKPQGPTLIQLDKKCATAIINNTETQLKSKSMDMRCYWLCDIACQKQFHIHWKRGEYNLSGYTTKHHATNNHISVRPTYVLNNIRSFFTNLSTRVC